MSCTCLRAPIRSLQRLARSRPLPVTLPSFSSPLRFNSSSSVPPPPPATSELAPPRPEKPAKPKGKAKTQPKQRAKKELPELREEDLEESFVRGSGPGGQATNKTSNACSLIHVPTGLRVLCHDTRSRETNRKVARRWLREKLDQYLSPPGTSARDLLAARERQKKEAKRRKGKRSGKHAAGGTGAEAAELGRKEGDEAEGVGGEGGEGGGEGKEGETPRRGEGRGEGPTPVDMEGGSAEGGREGGADGVQDGR